ncbi:MAG TPA: ABC transporter permease [Mycobacteriales bacterium]|jgi:ABC-type transport system involved in multi-copper enzyme maturation permease subunit|nr:ABC transporter permease [Mycobacteriales bacterium]
MTTMTVAAAGRHSGREGVSLPRVINSEWIKFRSLRSSWIAFAAALVAAIGLGILFSAVRAHNFGNIQHATGPNGQSIPASVIRQGFDPTLVSLRGLFLAQLAVGVLGVLMITGEYGTGMIRATLTSVPTRRPVLFAKCIVFGLFTFVISTAASLIAFLGGQAALHSDDLGVSLSSPGALRAVIGGGLFLMIVGLLGLGCGFAIRNTGGAIATLFGLILVLPLLAQAFPQSWQNHLDQYLPLSAGSQLITTYHESGDLHPLSGGLVFAAYAVVSLVIGAIVLARRDA